MKAKVIDKLANEIVEQARPMFAGKHQQAEGAALAELMAIHLLGYHIPRHPDQQTEKRKMIFNTWCSMVADLMNFYEAKEEEPTIQ